MSNIIVDNSGLITTRIKLLSQTAFDVERVQDIAPIIKLNKENQADSDFGWTEGRDMRHVARIPLIMLERWAKEAGISKTKVFSPEMGEIVARKLNDPDYAHFRTGGGLV